MITLPTSFNLVTVLFYLFIQALSIAMAKEFYAEGTSRVVVA
jgi:hypothetical protein